jgi:pyruvate/2-oxoglutarate dehydrogenase complex dihydrolipoamide dehydrogenase (E3) component
VTAGKTVLVGLPANVIKVAENQLKNLGIKTIYSAKVEGEHDLGGSTELSLSTGEKLTTDLYLPSVGVIPNTEYLPKSILNDKGDVMVDQYLKVKGVDGVWAAGDVIDIQAKQMTFASKFRGTPYYSLTLLIRIL